MTVSHKYPNTKPITPIRMPTFAMSLVCTIPVELAMALGGVDIGSTIAIEAQVATNIIIAWVPPKVTNAELLAAAGSDIPIATTMRIGISRAAVAELLMKLERK